MLLLLHRNIFNPSRRTHFLSHGWLGGKRSPWMNTHKDLLLDQVSTSLLRSRFESLRLC